MKYLNDLDEGLLWYKFKNQRGENQIVCFAHEFIEHWVQDLIAVRLGYRDKVLCLCRGQLARGSTGRWETEARVKQVG